MQPYMLRKVIITPYFMIIISVRASASKNLYYFYYVRQKAGGDSRLFNEISKQMLDLYISEWVRKLAKLI